MVSTGPALGTRWRAPRLPEPLVRRSRLEDILAEDGRRFLKLVSAPPGTGKTTLLASWADRADTSVAWLTVEGRDNIDGRFAAAVADALAAAAVVSGAVATGEHRGVDLIEAVLRDVEERSVRCGPHPRRRARADGGRGARVPRVPRRPVPAVPQDRDRDARPTRRCGSEGSG